jgi:4-oxalocrotonate tautomerase
MDEKAVSEREIGERQRLWPSLARSCMPAGQKPNRCEEAPVPEVHVYLAEGRSAEQKKKIMKAITEAVTSSAGVDVDSVTVQIIEAPNTDKMKGGVTFVERNAKK